ncbi:hypothetical protein JZO72_05865 [Vagococcus fluvialis]|uniref:hypothetical protein n=1 Tax=Vagococcus fluvialis TaxID=2738 RepID=UPI001A8C0AE3|nr:hypothetical protein [Vagococcus fluvialis]MBO0479151.1 hypothetical protein [Vagococcus fluvialis]MBO0484707.1 hypothetical protein [Vagococcus fluvialis]
MGSEDNLKKQIIKENFGTRLLNTGYKEMTLSEKINLAALLQGFHVKNLRDDFGTYEDFNDNNSPLFLNGYEKLADLFQSKIICVSEMNDPKVFIFEGDEIPRFRLTIANYFLNIKSEDNIKDEDLFNFLKYPNMSIIDSEGEMATLWNELVTDELVRLFEYQLSELRFVYKKDNDYRHLVDYFNGLYKILNPAQIYALIWMAVRQADNSRTRGTWGNFKFKHVNFILKIMEDIRIKKTNNNDMIEAFEYPYASNISLVSRVFFDQVMLCPEWFVSKVPSIEIDIGMVIGSKELLFYDGLLKREKQIDNFNIWDYSYYYLTNFGIVAFDGMVTWLFSDEKTLYQLYKLYPSDRSEDSKENFYHNIDIPYYIEESYSTSFLLKLIQTFMEKDIDNHVPENDSKQIIEIEERLMDSL